MIFRDRFERARALRDLMRPPSSERQRGFILNPYAFGGGGGSPPPPPPPTGGTVTALAHFFGGTQTISLDAPDEISAAGYWLRSGGTTWGNQVGVSPPFAGAGIADCGGSASGKWFESAGFTSTELNLGNGDFCIDFWIRYEQLLNTLLVFRGNPFYSWVWTMSGAGQVEFNATSTGASYDIVNSQPIHTPTVGVWYHYACTREGPNLRLFVNGALIATINIGTVSLWNSGGQIFLGQSITRHYISEFRLVKGAAIWTAAFTPPSTRYSNGRTEQTPADSQIFSLLKFNGASGSTTITDSALTPALTWTATAPAVVSTAQSKFGGSSLNPTGTDGKVTAPYNAAMVLGANDWTITAWAYPTATDQGFVFDWRSSFGFIIQTFSSIWQFLASTSGAAYEVNITSEVADWAPNAWNHLMMTRRGDVVRAYLNGKWIGSRRFTGTAFNPGVQYIVGGLASAFWFRGFVDEFAVIKGAGQWAHDTTAAVPTTAYLEAPSDAGVTVSLLHFNGTNGSTVLTDTAGKVWSRMGAPAISTAQSKFGGASLGLNGTTDYIAHPGCTDFEFSNGDWTVECFARSIDCATRFNCVFDFRGTDSSNNLQTGLAIYMGSTGDLRAYSSILQGQGGTVSNNTWHHIAVTRDGNTIRGFVDGVQAFTFTDTRVYTRNQLVIGQTIGGVQQTPAPTVAQYFSGHIDEVRITKGAALYRANFVPPTVEHPDPTMPFDAFLVELTSHLRFNGDNNATSFPDRRGIRWTPQGGAVVTTSQSKYGGGSLDLNGTDAYITAEDSTNWQPGTDEFTIEFFARRTSNVNGFYGMLSRDLASGWAPYLIACDVQGGNGQLKAYSTGAPGAWNPALSASTANNMPLNTWVHVAFVKYLGGRFRLFCDGVLVEEGLGVNTTLASPGENTHIGSRRLGVAPFPGQIDEFRYTRSARYLAAFTPPSAQFIDYSIDTVDAIGAGVALLLHLDGTNGSTVILDSGRAPKPIAVVGNAQISTAQSRFGGASLLLDGTGDAITAPNGSDFDLGSSSWTMECFVRLDPAISSNRVVFAKQQDALTVAPFACMLDHTGTLRIFTSNNGIGYQVALASSAGAVPFSTWTHIAFVRNGDIFSIYANGDRVGTATVAAGTLMVNSTPISVGGCANGDNSFQGHIDEVRITKGWARYTGARLTVPTAAFPDDAIRVTSLLHFEGSNGSQAILDSISGPIWTSLNGARVTNTTAKFGSTALELTASSNMYVKANESAAFGFGAEDFCMECWIYLAVGSPASTRYILDNRKSGGVGIGLGINSSGQLFVVDQTTTLIAGSTSLAAGAWHHVAVSRFGTTLRLLANGASEGTATFVRALNASCAPAIGATFIGTAPWNGHIDEVRFTKGAPIYTGAYTLPTARYPDA
jgi:hypothetical protein